MSPYKFRMITSEMKFLLGGFSTENHTTLKVTLIQYKLILDHRMIVFTVIVE